MRCWLLPGNSAICKHRLHHQQSTRTFVFGRRCTLPATVRVDGPLTLAAITVTEHHTIANCTADAGRYQRRRS